MAFGGISFVSFELDAKKLEPLIVLVLAGGAAWFLWKWYQNNQGTDASGADAAYAQTAQDAADAALLAQLSGGGGGAGGVGTQPTYSGGGQVTPSANNTTSVGSADQSGSALSITPGISNFGLPSSVTSSLQQWLNQGGAPTPTNMPGTTSVFNVAAPPATPPSTVSVFQT